jgi:putative nucleotidyltransferase with HDIG domain
MTISPPATSDQITEIEELLPEIKLIADDKLRIATARIWYECWKESVWADGPLAEVPKNTELPPERKLIQHTRSVTQLALSAAEILQANHGLEFDRDIVISAAILHDVCKLYENELGPDGRSAQHSRAGDLIQHGVYGAFKAWEKDLPLDLVHNIVVHTRGSKTLPKTWEALIVHYVDYLDSDSLLFNHGKKLLLTK